MPKKKFGQNFLINEDLCNKIIELEKIKNKNVLEIGPGNLALTKKIICKNPKKFFAIEIDKYLIEKYKSNSISNYIYNADALTIDENSLFKRKEFIIISNLPFNISIKLLIKWLKFQNENSSIKSMILMFQKELAERIIAKENTKKFGRVTILCNAFFNIEKKIDIKKGNFYPVPKVDATVLKFTPLKKRKIHQNNFHKLEKITSFFFNQRRKKIEKKIKKIFNEDQIKKRNLNKYFNYRPEDLGCDVYYKFSEIL